MLLDGKSWPTRESDVYAFSILIAEGEVKLKNEPRCNSQLPITHCTAVLLRGCPYGEEDLKVVLREVGDPLVCRRPLLPSNCDPRLVELLKVIP